MNLRKYLINICLITIILTFQPVKSYSIEPTKFVQSIADVDNIVTSGRGFAVLKNDGSLVSWDYDSSSYSLSYFTETCTKNIKNVL